MRDGDSLPGQRRRSGKQLDPRSPLNRILLSNFEWARETIREGTAGNAEIAEAHKGLGFMFIGQENWEEAENHIRQSLRLGADDAENRANLAKVLLSTGKAQEALDEAESAIELDPTLSDGWELLTAVLGQQHQHERVVETVLRASATTEPSSSLYERGARAASELGKKRQTAEFLRAAVRLEPDRSDLFLELERLERGLREDANRQEPDKEFNPEID